MAYDKEKRKAYDAAWRAANPGKATARQAAWRAANPEKVKASQTARYAANAEQLKACNTAWRAANPEKVKARDAAYRAANIEKERARQAAWYIANPEKAKEKHDRRRARKANAPINDFTAAQWVAMQAMYDHRCAYCGKRCKGKLTQDHILALSKGGSHTLSNIAPSCRRCNSRKHVGPVLVPVQPLLLVETISKKG